MSVIAKLGERKRSRRWLGCTSGDGCTENDRGDVPGWVLVTLMTAGLVIALWAIAGPALVDVFKTAIDRVTGV